MPESPATRSEIDNALDKARRYMATDLGLSMDVDIRGPTFVDALPELLAHSEQIRLIELRQDIERVTKLTGALVSASKDSMQQSKRLVVATYILAAAAFSTFAVGAIQLYQLYH